MLFLLLLLPWAREVGNLCWGNLVGSTAPTGIGNLSPAERVTGWARAAPVCAYLVWSSPSLPRSGSNSPGRSINAAVSQNVNVLLKMFLSISVSVNRVAFFSRSRYFGKNHIRFSISPMKLGQADSRFLPTKCRNPPSLLSPLCTDSSPYVVKPHKI